ncbi:MAG: ribokinase [Rhodospirillaceae bacterium]|nr:ribokinase [Rhodospirillaceae bacterium]
MSGGVVVVGSLHLDVVVTAPRLPELDETLMGETVKLVCGGKGGNQAVAASRHGASTTMLGRVGGDVFATALVDNLREAGVDTSLIQRDAEAMSGLSVAVVGADGEYGAVVVSSANRQLSADGFVFPEGARVLVLQNEVPEAVNRAVAAEARKSDATVVLNAAPMRPMAPELMQSVDILIVNRIEASALFEVPIHAPRDALGAAKRAGDGFDGEIVVTLGRDGLVHRDRRGKVRHHAARPVRVVSAHGAGDVFVGALCARLAASAAMEDALAYAQDAAARFVSTPLRERGISFAIEGSRTHAE